MTLQATALLLAVSMLGPGLLPSNDSNLLKHDRNVMENLAHLGAVPKAKQSEQLELFVDLGPLPVLPEKVVENFNTSPNDSRLGVAAPVSSLSQLVQVSLTQTDQNPSNYGLHTSVTLHRGEYSLDDSEYSKVSTISPCNTNDIGSIADFPDSGTSKSLSGELPKSLVHSGLPSPLDFILGPKGPELSERVLARLIQAEAHESNTSLRSDYRQAFICVSLAAKGNKQAFLESSYAVHGVHQDKVWPRILANRKERLGREYYQFFDSNDLPRPDVKWDATVIYDLPSSAEGFTDNRAVTREHTGTLPAHKSVEYSADSSLAATALQPPSLAAKGGDGPENGREPSPLPPNAVPNRKERLA